MINAEAALAAVLASSAPHVTYTREQAIQMWTEHAVGQRARRALTNLKTVTAVAANAAGSPA